MTAETGRAQVPDPAMGISELVRRWRAERPEQRALIDGATVLTWAELDAATTRAARGLLAAGLSAGDRVAIQVSSGAPFSALYLGALRAGLIAVPVNPTYTTPELRYVLTDSGASLLVTDSVAALGERESLPVPRVIAAVPESGDEGSTLGDLLAHGDGPDPAGDRHGPETAVVLYTSGTSGRPRGAMLSAAALLANLEQMSAVQPPLMRGDDVGYVPVPLFHIFGLNVGLGMTVHAGATAVLAGRFDPADSLATMAERKVTVVIGAPGMLAAWLAHPDFRRGFATVRFALSGSAPLAPALVDRYAEEGVALFEGYGLTECAPAVTLNAGDAKPGSIGRPLPGVEVELRDPDGEPITEDDPGQLIVRGPNLFSGYWPDGVDGPDEDGWFATGDIGLWDEDGELLLVGRTTELVVINGFNVYPAEVEAVLGAQPGVAEVSVLGVDDDETGEAVLAYVVPVSGAPLDPDAMLAQAATSLARFKLPRRIEIVDALPHTVTGKVMKWRLRPARSADASS
jgi:long-chain acyl-CoA synthetase